MSYLVFARKYRPQTFAEILGQEAIVTTLTNAIRQRRIAHAYLFAGPRGTGKTSTARIFAKAINCREGPTPTPCLSCERCQEIAKGAFLDVLEIDGASNRGIDQIRALRELAKFTPASGAFKVYIIDEVHQITSEGFNALLKTLEEPPPHVLFILATTAPHKVPATILSRCQRYDFKRLSLDLIVSKLKAIAADEKLKIAQEAAVAIARASGGSLRDAESLLDQAAAFTGGAIAAADLTALLGMMDEETFAEAVECIQARDPVRGLKLISEMSNEGTDLTQWALDFLAFLRNLLVVKVGAAPLGLEGLGAESVARLSVLSEKLTIEDLTAIAQVIERAIETMRRAGEPRIPLEMALIRLSRAVPLAAVSDLIAQVSAAIEGNPGDAPAVSAPSAAQPKAAQPTPSPVSSSLTLDQVKSVWPEFLNQLHAEKASAAAYLSQAAPVGLREGDPPKLVIGFLRDFDFHRKAMDRPDLKAILERILSKLLGRPLRCALEMVEKLPDLPAAAAASGASPIEGKPDAGMLNSVIELFEGRVMPGDH